MLTEGTSKHHARPKGNPLRHPHFTETFQWSTGVTTERTCTCKKDRATNRVERKMQPLRKVNLQNSKIFTLASTSGAPGNIFQVAKKPTHHFLHGSSTLIPCSQYQCSFLPSFSCDDEAHSPSQRTCFPRKYGTKTRQPGIWIVWHNKGKTPRADSKARRKSKNSEVT